MKHIMYGIVLGIITILSIFLVVSIEGQTTRENEIDNALPNAVERALEVTYESGAYAIEDNEEFIADFTQNLLNDINTGDRNEDGVLDPDESHDETLKVKVDVAGIDYDKGLLSIKVTETYTSLSGKERKAEYEATALLEKPKEREVFVLQFTKPDGSLFKEIKYTYDEKEVQTLEEIQPEQYSYTYSIPGKELVYYSNEADITKIAALNSLDKSKVVQKTFVRWEDTETGEEITFPLTVSGNRTVVAIYQ